MTFRKFGTRFWTPIFLLAITVSGAFPLALAAQSGAWDQASPGESSVLEQAGKLAASGQYAAAMLLYRQVFGMDPPAGDWALTYYETEAATGEGRAHAIAGLTMLSEKYPAEARYQIALGRILTYDPGTREQGRRMLEANGRDAKAKDAVRQSLLWDAANPAMAGEIRAYLTTHHDPQLAKLVETTAAERAPAHSEDGPERWRELFVAQFESGDAALALQTEARIPPAKCAELMQDPLFLRTLAAAYKAVGRDGEAQAVLQGALELPFPADARGLTADTQMQFAGILVAANRLEQAAGLYRLVVMRDDANAAAWRGLVRAEHALGHDREALKTAKSMPPASYAAALRDTNFERTMTTIYQAERRLDEAQELLEKTLAGQMSGGRKPATATEMELANFYLERRNTQLAYPMYQRVLMDDPDDAEAWAGLLAALHLRGRDKDAVAQVELIPEAARAGLQSNVRYVATMAAVYGALGQTQRAAVHLNHSEATPRLKDYVPF